MDIEASNLRLRITARFQNLAQTSKIQETLSYVKNEYKGIISNDFFLRNALPSHPDHLVLQGQGRHEGDMEAKNINS